MVHDWKLGFWGWASAVFNSFVVCCWYYMSDAITILTRFSRVGLFSYHPKVTPYPLSIFVNIVFPTRCSCHVSSLVNNQIYVHHKIEENSRIVCRNWKDCFLKMSLKEVLYAWKKIHCLYRFFSQFSWVNCVRKVTAVIYSHVLDTSFPIFFCLTAKQPTK